MPKGQVAVIHFINNIGNSNIDFIYQDLRIHLPRETVKGKQKKNFTVALE